MKRKELILIAVIAVFITALSKIFIDTPNFSPIGAIALMAGAFIGRKVWAFVLPIIALFLADILISGTSPIYQEYFWSSGMFFTYLGFLIIVLLGVFIHKKVNLVSVIGGSLGAAVLFFVFSNFGSFLFLPEYTKDLNGLVLCYTRAIEFFRATLFSQVLFSVILFYAYSWSTKQKTALA